MRPRRTSERVCSVDFLQRAERTAVQNRALACERMQGQQMQGFLAYLGGAPVGWCNAAPRDLLHALDDEPVPDSERVGSIVCFLVEPSHRAVASHVSCSRRHVTGCASKALALWRRTLEQCPPQQLRTTLVPSVSTCPLASSFIARTTTVVSSSGAHCCSEDRWHQDTSPRHLNASMRQDHQLVQERLHQQSTF